MGIYFGGTKVEFSGKGKNGAFWSVKAAEETNGFWIFRRFGSRFLTAFPGCSGIIPISYPFTAPATMLD